MKHGAPLPQNNLPRLLHPSNRRWRKPKRRYRRCCHLRLRRSQSRFQRSMRRHGRSGTHLVFPRGWKRKKCFGLGDEFFRWWFAAAASGRWDGLRCCCGASIVVRRFVADVGGSAGFGSSDLVFCFGREGVATVPFEEGGVCSISNCASKCIAVPAMAPVSAARSTVSWLSLSVCCSPWPLTSAAYP